MADLDDDQELTEEERAAAQQQAAKRKKRLIYIGAGATVLVLALAGILAWVFLAATLDEEALAAREAQRPEAAAQRAIYYPLAERFTINYDVRGRQRFLQVEVTLMLRDDAAVRGIETHMPRIRNDLVMLFSGQVFEDLQTPEGKELLRQDALRQVQNVLEQEIGRPAVEQVLFTSFVMQ
ncbi:flagellar basal body-associated FliL family protein [Marinimicrobium sp. ABcell2]|uniref:flagellar basal body-associated FliL family protein n=1 Tax=Marinimicrobium sp. ABcell2 TaxID=3069751 RepID=UPI0027B50334|nr:flagellar basal body-associated FliL family protein [Marinimicrobium sp. ABcell2]MDQ2078088.1 flagellar basal body-associated FliL family protein [Marinimicrobium sp. ABcell2]